MKYQSLISGENKKNIISYRELAKRMVKVKTRGPRWSYKAHLSS